MGNSAVFYPSFAVGLAGIIVAIIGACTGRAWWLTIGAVIAIMGFSTATTGEFFSLY
jgi:hypothetical protein